MTKVDEGLVLIADAARVLSRVLRRSAEAQVGLDPLPASEFDLLQFVYSHPDSAVSDVARALQLQTSNVSTTVRSLVERGLVVRVPDARDQRRTRLRMSSTAERRRLMVESAWVVSLASALDEMAEEDVAALLSAAPALARLAKIVTLREVHYRRFATR